MSIEQLSFLYAVIMEWHKEVDQLCYNYQRFGDRYPPGEASVNLQRLRPISQYLNDKAANLIRSVEFKSARSARKQRRCNDDKTGDTSRGSQPG